MRGKMRHAPELRTVGIILSVFLALWVFGSLTFAQEDEAAARGKTTYRVYCSNCHGREARGDGKLAELLKVKPADLTQIARRNGGAFPEEEIHRVIDGREPVEGHGRQEMPVWGLTFQDPARDNTQEEEVTTRIRELVTFLKSIQER